MSYTRDEIIIVEDAIATPCCHLEAAYTLITSFIGDYFESDKAIQRLLFDVQNRHNLVSAQVYAISHLLYEAKCALDTFTDPDNDQLKAFLSRAREMQEIVDVLNHKEPCHE